MPMLTNAAMEGDPHPGRGDRHLLALDKDNCFLFLYELYGSYPRQQSCRGRAIQSATYTPSPPPIGSQELQNHRRTLKTGFNL
jgi:hypothetical protein